MKRIAAVAVASLVAIAIIFFTASGPVGQHASLGISAARAGTGDAKVLNPCAPPGLGQREYLSDGVAIVGRRDLPGEWGAISVRGLAELDRAGADVPAGPVLGS